MADVLPLLFVIATGVALSIVLLAFWNSFRGLLARGGGAAVAGVHEHAGRAALLRERETLLTAIRELRLEHELGKVSDGDFERLDQRYRTRAREVLRELDEQLAPYRPQAKAMLEAALGKGGAEAAAGAVADAASGAGSASDAGSGSASGSVSLSDAGSGSSSPVVLGAACAQCKTRNDEDAVFCKKCGRALREGAKA
jgi:hypothetical protein